MIERHTRPAYSESLNFSAPETHHHLWGIFADVDTVRAILYTDAPYTSR